MELPLQLRGYYYEEAPFVYKVSILVLMELPLQPSFSKAVEVALKCFNPCFNGTTSATT